MNPKKILLADDDLDDRILFEEAYKSRTDIILLPSAINGAQVIEILESADHGACRPDLIVLDQNMPQMTGKQTLSYLKSDARFRHIPVCVCSTYADHQLTVDCLKLGAFKVSSKPITQEEYQKMMNDFLSVFDQ
ncbi:MAG: response regulator [Chryseosolibacter sp.]